MTVGCDDSHSDDERRGVAVCVAHQKTRFNENSNSPCPLTIEMSQSQPHKTKTTNHTPEIIETIQRYPQNIQRKTHLHI